MDFYSKITFHTTQFLLSHSIDIISTLYHCYYQSFAKLCVPVGWNNLTLIFMHPTHHKTFMRFFDPGLDRIDIFQWRMCLKIDYITHSFPADTSRNNYVVITSKWRHFDVKMTSFWRYNDVIITSCVQWVHTAKCQTLGYNFITCQVFLNWTDTVQTNLGQLGRVRVTKCRQTDNIVVTGGTVSCQNLNLQWNQWRQCCQLMLSVNVLVPNMHQTTNQIPVWFQCEWIVFQCESPEM